VRGQHTEAIDSMHLAELGRGTAVAFGQRQGRMAMQNPLMNLPQLQAAEAGDFTTQLTSALALLLMVLVLPLTLPFTLPLALMGAWG
jgi:hypothetical protein